MRLLEKICLIAAKAGGFLLFGLAILISIDVLVRWLARKPILGVFEVSEIIFLVSIFLAAGLVHLQGRQMRVDLLLLHAQGRWKHSLEAFADILALAFFGLLLWEAGGEWLHSWHGHFVRRGMIEIPNVLHLGFLIFGTLLIWLALLATTLRNVLRIFAPGEPGRTHSQAAP